MTTTLPESPAVLSSDRRYRYVLRRRVGLEPGRVCFIMLNPSTADESIDDPTIRRCMDFTRRWDQGELVVVNLFAWRSSDPSALLVADDPVGPDNATYIMLAAACSSTVVAAWGAIHPKYGRWALHVAGLFTETRLSCLGRTKAGWPRHPLYVAAQTPLETYVT